MCKSTDALAALDRLHHDTSTSACARALAGTDVNCRDGTGVLTLHLNPLCARALPGTDVNCRDAANVAPQPALCACSCRYGADVNQPCRDGTNVPTLPIDVACETPFPHSSTYAAVHAAATELRLACGYPAVIPNDTQLEIPRYLIRNGADISGSFRSAVGGGSSASNRRTPCLVQAAINGNVAVMNMLLDMGADATVTCGGEHDGSALFFLIANRGYGVDDLPVCALDPMIEKVRLRQVTCVCDREESIRAS
jgi:hypothetical protein